tara:strand:+ start:562 stop:732 length:171 start_codon:yes stop_codon:yes gene_type:complete
MVRYLIIILLLSSCGRDLDLNPWTTVLKQIYKVEYDESRVKTMATLEEKHPRNTLD